MRQWRTGLIIGAIALGTALVQPRPVAAGEAAQATSTAEFRVTGKRPAGNHTADPLPPLVEPVDRLPGTGNVHNRALPQTGAVQNAGLSLWGLVVLLGMLLLAWWRKEDDQHDTTTR